MAKLTKAQQADREATIDTLRDLIKPGDVITTSLKHVSRSGMMRHISLYIVRDGGIRDITHSVAEVIGVKVSPETGGLKMGGAGMDMGFSAVYSLSSALFRDEFYCIGRGCPSNDHSNDYGNDARKWNALHKSSGIDSTDHAVRVAATVERQDWIAAQEAEHYSPLRKHSDAGYALTQRWI